jgi:GTP diphosphokinase / guanosine-3',5'-bis(diphosphate) 3'-diphosphatase
MHSTTINSASPMTSAALKSLIDAVAFAAEKHRDQRRKDRHSSPYINHPIALAHVLAFDASVADEVVLIAAVLHDTIEDTGATADELAARFGAEVAQIVREVTDDKSLSPERRKQLQIEHAPQLSRRARMVKLADKICNLRDVAHNPPKDWSLERRRRYFDWAKAVIDGLRGPHPGMEALFDAAYGARP